MPRSFNLSENDAIDIENYAKTKNSEIFADMHLHDLEDYYLDGYENAVRIYNQKEVDELVIYDITKTTQGEAIDFNLIEKIA